MRPKNVLFAAIICAQVLFALTRIMAGDSTKYKYFYKLSKPDSPNMTYEDSLLAVQFSINDKSIEFTLKNNGSNVLRIIWDEVTVVKYGTAKKVIHKGTKFADKDKTQVPTVVPPDARVEESLIPADNVELVAGGWKIYDLYFTEDLGKPEFQKDILGSKGKKFSLYLPITIQGRTLDYFFEFIIVNVLPLPKLIGE